MWTLQMYNNKQFKLTDKQAEIYKAAIKKGVELVDFGDFIVSKHFSWLAKDEVSQQHEKLESIRKNPILQDETYRKWKKTDDPKLASILDKRYPLPRYQKEWDEADKEYLSLSKI